MIDRCMEHWVQFLLSQIWHFRSTRSVISFTNMLKSLFAIFHSPESVGKYFEMWKPKDLIPTLLSFHFPSPSCQSHSDSLVMVSVFFHSSTRGPTCCSWVSFHSRKSAIQCSLNILFWILWIFFLLNLFLWKKWLVWCQNKHLLISFFLARECLIFLSFGAIELFHSQKNQIFDNRLRLQYVVVKHSVNEIYEVWLMDENKILWIVLVGVEKHVVFL